jgi:hypothetical protein
MNKLILGDIDIDINTIFGFKLQNKIKITFNIKGK